MEEFEVYKYHNGKLDMWGASGYNGTHTYKIKEPDNPCGGIQVHAPAIPLPIGGH